MTTKTCNVCHGRGGPIEIECPDCDGTGFDPTEEKPFAQCHTCFGEETIVVDECPNCCDTGEVDVDDE